VVGLPVGTLAGPLTSAPWVRDGEAHEEPSTDLQPVALLQLATTALTLRGDRPDVRADVASAQEYCRANLTTYWSPLLESTGAALARRAPDEPCGAEGVMWIGLGPARLWHTITTGEIVGKTTAGELAAAKWPDLAPRLRDILAVRAGGTLPLDTGHGLAAVELGRRVVTDARRA
jgi:hypothetical protein